MTVKERFAKLIDVKSVVTIILTLVFAYLAIVKVIDAAQYLSVFTVVVAFYFGTQYNKNVTSTDKGEK